MCQNWWMSLSMFYSRVRRVLVFNAVGLGSRQMFLCIGSGCFDSALGSAVCARASGVV